MIFKLLKESIKKEEKCVKTARKKSLVFVANKGESKLLRWVKSFAVFWSVLVCVNVGTHCGP